MYTTGITRADGKATYINVDKLMAALRELRYACIALGRLNPNARSADTKAMVSRATSRVEIAEGAVETAYGDLAQEAYKIGVGHGRLIAGQKYVCSVCEQGFADVRTFGAHAFADDAQIGCLAAFEKSVVV